MRCAIYCRYSSEKQRDGYSIEAQLKECERFIEMRGWSLVQRYVDEARSGRSDERESFLRMISDSELDPKPFERIVVYKLDRFGRNLRDYLNYKDVLKKSGIRICSVSEPIGHTEQANPIEIIIESVIGGIAQSFSEANGERVLLGMIQNAQRGLWNGGYPPFGFRTVETNVEGKGVKRRLEIEQSEAHIVRKVFDMYVEDNLGAMLIAQRLNAAGHRARGGHRFARNTILRILKCEKSVGDMTFGKAAKNGSPEPLTIKNTHKAIVDRGRWEAAQEKLRSRAFENAHPRQSSSQYLFSGIMECGFCGCSMTGSSGTSRHGSLYRYYACGNALRTGPRACAQRKWPAQDLENRIIEALKKKIGSENAMKEIVQELRDLDEESKGTADFKIEALREEIRSIDMKIRKLIEAIEEGIVTSQGVGQRLGEHRRIRSEKELEISRLKAVKNTIPVEMTDEILKIWMDGILNTLNSDPSLRNREGLHRLIKHVKIEKTAEGFVAVVTYTAQLDAEQEAVELGSSEKKVVRRPLQYTNPALPTHSFMYKRITIKLEPIIRHRNGKLNLKLAA